MDNKWQEFFNKLDSYDQLNVLEIAYYTLKDENLYESVANYLDASDDHLMPLLVSLTDLLDDFEGFEGQDRENYTDTQDRENYS